MTVQCQCPFPQDSGRGHVRLLKGEHILLSTPALQVHASSHGWGPEVPAGAMLPMGAISTCCSSTLSSLTAEGSSERPSKGFSSPEGIYAKDPRSLQATGNGVFLPLMPSQEHFSFQYSPCWDRPVIPETEIDSCPCMMASGYIVHPCQLKPCAPVALLCQAMDPRSPTDPTVLFPHLAGASAPLALITVHIAHFL